jgi:ribosomal protein S18 acetylase RimI-like enzyme
MHNGKLSELSKSHTLNIRFMSCEICGKQAVYRCSVCGKPLCTEHARLQTICPTHQNKTAISYTITKAKTKQERDSIQKFVELFWGEQEQLAFDRKHIVKQLPAFIAKTGKHIIGFTSYTEQNNAIIIVALGILSQYQNAGVGKSLVKKVEAQAKKQKKNKLLVATSNDDLPALGFYQSLGFQIFEVKPNVIAQKHGKTLKGINGLPVRDEIRLQKTL